jgi:hypothetical protein
MLRFEARGLCVNSALPSSLLLLLFLLPFTWGRHRRARATTALPVASSLYTCSSMAESCSGKPGQAVPLGRLGRKIITNGFRSTGLLRQERLRKSAANCKPAGQRAAQASQANGRWASWAAKSKQTVFG